ncbi:MAG: OsmC family protein [Chloroflexota bacterium]
MAQEISAQVVLQEDMRFSGTAGSGYSVQLDGTAEVGSQSGLTPMEMMLIGLAGCSAMDVVAILEKKRQPVQGLEVRAFGNRRDTYPTVFDSVTLEYIVRGDGIEPEDVEHAIHLSRERYCPVWAMFGESATITATFQLVQEAAAPMPGD